MCVVTLEPPHTPSNSQRYNKYAPKWWVLVSAMCTWKESVTQIPSITAPSYQDGSLRGLARAQAVRFGCYNLVFVVLLRGEGMS
jgi:hypothetical protein